jgi:hypothetical protein
MTSSLFSTARLRGDVDDHDRALAIQARPLRWLGLTLPESGSAGVCPCVFPQVTNLNPAGRNSSDGAAPKAAAVSVRPRRRILPRSALLTSQHLWVRR